MRFPLDQSPKEADFCGREWQEALSGNEVFPWGASGMTESVRTSLASPRLQPFLSAHGRTAACLAGLL